MSLVKLLFFTYVVVISQAKIARRSFYKDAEILNSMEEEQPKMELPFDMDDLREDERVVNTLASADDRQTKNHKRTPVRMPDELIRLLKNVKSSSEAKRIIESQLVKRGEEDEIEKRTETISVAATIKCPVPRNKTVITTYASPNTAAIPLGFSGSTCAPYLSTVQLNPPANGFYQPGFIQLHRCGGACEWLDPDIWHCKLTAQEEIKYRVYRVSHTSSGYVEIKVMNHTACACGCVIKEHHCNADTMWFDEDTCRCECIYNESSCASNKKWDASNCVCECKFPVEKCSAGKKWSTETCKCQ